MVLLDRLAISSTEFWVAAKPSRLRLQMEFVRWQLLSQYSAASFGIIGVFCIALHSVVHSSSA
jgi:hypothetical protein